MLLGEGKETDWKIINYRSVGDLVTAEYLHDLYNQTVIELNPVHFRNTVCVIEEGMFKSFAPQKEWDTLAETLGERIIRDKKLRQNFSKYLERSQTDLTDLIAELQEKYTNKIDSISSADAFYDLQELHFLALDRIYAINLVQFEHAFGHAIEKLAQSENIDVDKLLKSSHLTMSGQEEIAALELSLKISAQKITLEKAVSQHEEEFGAINLAYGADKENFNVSSVARLESLLQQSKVQRQKRLEELKKATTQDTETTDNALLQDIVDLAKKMRERRDRNKALMGRVASVRAKIMAQAAVLGGIDRSELRHYFLKDISSLLIQGDKLSEKEIEKRKTRIVLQRQEREIYGAEAISLSEHVFPHVSTKEQKKDIQGIVASSGLIKGKVRRVYGIEDARQIKNDEVLVAFGTDFDLMVGLQNCAGVVTEEGGLLSHASVISRELGKPCVINVKNAMSIFQDGDVIELNAKTGMIKLLERPSVVQIDHNALSFLDGASIDEITGAKAQNLQILMKAGIAVLPAVQLTIDDLSDVDELSQTILKKFAAKGVATNSFLVRSNTENEDSNDQSMAGQFESVEAQAEAGLLSKAIKDVMTSYATPKTKGLKMEEYDNNTVLIQPYYPQKYGGVAFSRHPVTGKQEIVIEASDKGARAVVEGLDSTVSIPADIEKQVKTEIIKIEDILGYPVDVEWGFGRDGLKIFQARPIIFKDKPQNKKEASRKLIIIAGGQGSRIKEMFNEKSAPFTKHFLPLPEKGGSILGAIIEKSRSHFDEIEISASRNTIEFTQAHFSEQDSIHISNDQEMIGPLGPPFLELLAEGKRVFACCGDVYSNFDWEKMERFHDNHDQPVTILTSKSFPADKAACFNIDNSGMVAGWDRKDRSSEDDYINIGGYILDPDPELVKIAQELIDMKKCKEDLFFERCIEKGILAAYKEPEFSCNINTPEVYQALVKKILTKTTQRAITPKRKPPTNKK